MSDFYNNLIEATSNMNELNFLRYGAITEADEEAVTLVEENGLIHKNVPCKRANVGDKVLFGFVENNLHDPVVLVNFTKTNTEGGVDCYTKEETDDLLNNKANAEHGHEAIDIKLDDYDILDDYVEDIFSISSKANRSELNNYYNKTETYNKGEVDALIDESGGFVASDYYTKTDTDNLLNTKANTSDLNNYYPKTETYNKNEVNDLISESEGFVADDYYTKTDTDNLLNNKANNSDLNNYYNKSETYTKTETNNLIPKIEWKTLTLASSGSISNLTAKYEPLLRLVSIQCNYTVPAVTSAGTKTIVANWVPTGYRPSVYVQDPSYAANRGVGRIGNNGTLYFQAWSTTSAATTYSLNVLYQY